MIKIAVIGFGYWGPKLFRNLSSIESCQVVAVADTNPERLDPIKRTHPGVRATTDSLELLRDNSIDAVAIATPVATHFELAHEALQNGKHVLLEKPMTTTAQESQQLIETAEANDLTLMVDHTFIYTGAVRKIKEFLDEGELGELYYFDSVRVNLGLFQHDVNVIWDLAPHDLSIMSYLIEEEPVSVTAVGASPIDYGDKELENIAYVTVNFASGLIAHVHVNWLSPVKVRKMLIGGSKKMIVYDDLEPDEKVKIYDKGVTIASAEQAYEALIQYRIGDAFMPVIPRHEALNVECRHFLDCIEDGTNPITDGREGLKVVELLEATDRSLRQGGRPVPVGAAAFNEEEKVAVPTPQKQ